MAKRSTIKTIKGAKRFQEPYGYMYYLGRFVTQFAAVELTMSNLLRYYAKVPYHLGFAVFSGVRTDEAMSLVRRIIQVDDPGKEAKADLEYIFPQLKIISDVRNDLLHHGATAKLGFIRKPTLTDLKQTPIPPEILYQMEMDLFKIIGHMVVHLDTEMRSREADSLSTPWQYKSPSQEELYPYRARKVGKQRSQPRSSPASRRKQALAKREKP